MRLNRYLAACGLGSRRSCESLIAAGRVTVNGRRVVNLATTVGEQDAVAVDGESVTPKRNVTLILHKPAGYLCTKDDPQGRPTIYDLLPEHLQNLSYVGRLDKDSEGLLVMTSDGELAHTLTHPRFKVEKLYLVALDRTFDMHEDGRALLKGMEIEEGFARVVSVHALSPRRLFVVLNQGYKRQLRQMFDSLGYGVKTLIRLRVGRLELGELASRRWRILRPEEILLLTQNPPARRDKRKSGSPRPGKAAPERRAAVPEAPEDAPRAPEVGQNQSHERNSDLAG